jgi:predicted transcriptional regulator of viral defense system
MDPLRRTVEEKLVRMAAPQHGVVTRRQLLEAGVTTQEIKVRLRRRSLLREHRGVYRVGHRAPSIEATYLAAVFACGDGAVLSGRAAAHVWGLVKGAPPQAEVITPTERRIEGVRTQRSRHLDAQDVTLFNAIPVTTVPRTVVDLAAEIPEDALARACHEAGVRHGLTPPAPSWRSSSGGRGPGVHGSSAESSRETCT